MNYKKTIRDSNIAFKIKKNAVIIFDIWVKNARKEYNLSSDFFIEAENGVIEKDFIDSFEKAILDLIEEKSAEKKKTPGWSYGFLCGSLQGRIDVCWYNRYILEKSEDFKDLLKMKALISYLNYDDFIVGKIAKVYDFLVKDKIKPVDLFENKNSNIYPFSEYSGSVKNYEFQENIIRILSENLEIKIMELLDRQGDNCCPDIDTYLTIDEVVEIVGKEHFA